MKLVVFEQQNTCAPCRALKPHISAVAEDLNIDLEFKEVSDNWDECLRHGVKSTPTVFLMNNSDVIYEVKSRTAASLVSELKEVVNGSR